MAWICNFSTPTCLGSCHFSSDFYKCGIKISKTCVCSSLCTLACRILTEISWLVQVARNILIEFISINTLMLLKVSIMNDEKATGFGQVLIVYCKMYLHLFLRSFSTLTQLRYQFSSHLRSLSYLPCKYPYIDHFLPQLNAIRNVRHLK